MSTYVITGANRGIGLELARQLHARGDRVIAACRQPSEALTAIGARVEADLEVTDPASVRAFAGRLADVDIDGLINCAGILRGDGLGALDYDDLRTQLEVNSIGPLRVTEALLPLLSKGSKVVIITSRMGSIADNTSGGMYGYRMSKAAVNAGGRSLALDLRDRGIAVQLLHPGFVKTDMTGGRGNWSAEESAAQLIARIDELDLDHTGTFRHANGEMLDW